MNKNEVKEALTPKVDPMYDPLGAMNEMLDAASELFKFEPSKKKSKKKKKKKKVEKKQKVSILDQEDDIKIDMDLYAKDFEYRNAVDKYKKAKTDLAIDDLVTKSVNLIMQGLLASVKMKEDKEKKKSKKNKKNKKSKEVYVEPQKVYYDVPEQKVDPVTYGTSSL